MSERERLDDAARAGWLYYVARRTQDEIAREMGVSRQKAQRLVAQAAQAGLVKVRLEHPIARCMELAGALKDRFGLVVAEVAPSDPGAPGLLDGIAGAAAAEMERVLLDEEPRIVAMGTGRALTAAVEQVALMERPQHRIVSLLGNMMLDGSATPFSATVRLAGRTGARHYPMSVPVLASSPEEVEMIRAQPPIASTLDLARQADVAFVGIGWIAPEAPLSVDGFFDAAEVAALRAAGAVGEITGWAFDAEGRILEGLTNDRATGFRPRPGPAVPMIVVGHGARKAPAIHAALTGRLVNGIVTDEATAAVLLRD
ncbi:MAG: sugar-binding transcriptional regulator [Hasllibacter sp.]